MTNTLRFSNDLLHDHQLCFVHIPKTAGTSFMNVLRAVVGKTNLLHVSPEALNGYEKPSYDIDQFDCISGHFPFEIYRLMKKTPLFLTFLREPSARAISNFQEYRRVDLNSPFVKQLPTYEFYLQVGEMTLENFINHPYFAEAIENLQTRMLGVSIPNAITSLPDLLYKKDTVSLELAKERLEQFMFIGLQEEFQKSMEMTAYQFGLFPLDDTLKLNESQQKMSAADLSDATLNRLQELNRLDIELYEFGQKLFRERYEQMVTEITPTDEKQPVIELLAKAYFEQKNKPKGLNYQLDFIYPQQGWYPVEAVGNEQWMWSGPGTVSTIDLPLDRSIKVRFQFQIRHSLSQDILNSLVLRIDDQPIKMERNIKNGIPYFQGIIPPNLQKKYELTRFSFHLKRTVYPPGVTAESPDARLLGVALGWIKMEPL